MPTLTAALLQCCKNPELTRSEDLGGRFISTGGDTLSAAGCSEMGVEEKRTVCSRDRFFLSFERQEDLCGKGCVVDNFAQNIFNF